jgi:hypothetical protein
VARRQFPAGTYGFYIGIIAWESVIMLLCWWAVVRLLKSIVRIGRDSPLH